MRHTYLNAKTLSEAWFNAIYGLGHIYSVTDPVFGPDKGVHWYKIDRGSHQGAFRLEYDHVTIRIEFPGTEPLTPIVPEGIPQPVAPGYLEKYMEYIMTDNPQPNEEYTYGTDLDKQIPEVIKMYLEDGYNQNQACMTIGSKNSIILKDPQCLRIVDTRIMDKKLHFIVYFRSWDLWSGFPANLGGLQILKKYMADEIGVGDGEILATSKGLHLYDHHFKVAGMLIHDNELFPTREILEEAISSGYSHIHGAMN